MYLSVCSEPFIWLTLVLWQTWVSIFVAFVCMGKMLVGGYFMHLNCVGMKTDTHIVVLYYMTIRWMDVLHCKLRLNESIPFFFFHCSVSIISSCAWLCLLVHFCCFKFAWLLGVMLESICCYMDALKKRIW